MSHWVCNEQQENKYNNIITIIIIITIYRSVWISCNSRVAISARPSASASYGDKKKMKLKSQCKVHLGRHCRWSIIFLFCIFVAGRKPYKIIIMYNYCCFIHFSFMDFLIAIMSDTTFSFSACNCLRLSSVVLRLSLSSCSLDWVSSNSFLKS